MRKKQESEGPRWRWSAVALLFLLSLALYLNTLGSEFVFDDVTLILQNPAVVNLDWWGILYEGGYRPVRTLTYGINYWIGGEDPFGYHLFNVLLHAANAALIYLFVLLLASSQRVAVLAGVFFTLHPAQTAAVAYVSGRKDLLAAFFVLLGSALYIAARKRRLSRWWAIGALASFLLAVLSKEVAIVFPSLVLLIDLILAWQEGRAGNRRFSIFGSISSVVRQSPFIYGAFVFAASTALYWALFINQASRMEGFWGGSFWTHLGTSLKLFAHYIKMIVLPYPLVADYTGGVFEVSRGLIEPVTLLSGLMTIGYLFLAVWIFKKLPLLSVGMIWVAVCLAPVLQLVPFHEIAADHFLYVPLIGAALATSILIDRLLVWSNESGGVWLAFGIMVLVMSVLVVDRNWDWRDKRSLWTATLEKAPDSYRANANLGLIYMQEGRVDEGIRMTRRAIELDPAQALPFANLGAVYYTMGQQMRQKGELDEAVSLQRLAMRELDKAIEIEPADPFKLSNLANAYREMANIYQQRRDVYAARQARERAEELYVEALSIPDARREVKNIWFNYGGLLVDRGEYAEAIEKYDHYLSAFPESRTAHYWLGYCRFQLGRYEAALTNLRIAAEEKVSLELGEMVAEASLRTGNHELRVEACRELKRLNPNSFDYRLDLTEAYLMTGKDEEALGELQEVLRMGALRARPSRVQSILRRFRAKGVEITKALVE